MIFKKTIAWLLLITMTIFFVCCALPKENCGKTAAKKHKKESRRIYGR